MLSFLLALTDRDWTRLTESPRDLLVSSSPTLQSQSLGVHTTTAGFFWELKSSGCHGRCFTHAAICPALSKFLGVIRVSQVFTGLPDLSSQPGL